MRSLLSTFLFSFFLMPIFVFAQDRSSAILPDDWARLANPKAAEGAITEMERVIHGLDQRPLPNEADRLKTTFLQPNEITAIILGFGVKGSVSAKTTKSKADVAAVIGPVDATPTVVPDDHIQFATDINTVSMMSFFALLKEKKVTVSVIPSQSPYFLTTNQIKCTLAFSYLDDRNNVQSKNQQLFSLTKNDDGTIVVTATGSHLLSQL